MRANPNMCLDNRGQAHNNGEVVIWECQDSDNLRWTYNMNTLASKHNSNIVADAYDYGNGGNVGQWEYNGRQWQEWELRPMSAINKWVDWRDKRKGKCIDVAGGVAANGTPVQLYSCNGTDAQKWFYNPSLGTMASALPGNFCLTTPNGNTSNSTQLQISTCVEGDVNQMFDKDGNRFNSRLNVNQKIDASGTNSGDPIIFYESNGGDNQKWRAGLY